MNSVSCAIWLSDSCIRLAIVPRIPLSLVTDVGSCMAGASGTAAGSGRGGRRCARAGGGPDEGTDVLGDSVAADTSIDRVGGDRCEVDAEQIGELAGGSRRCDLTAGRDHAASGGCGRNAGRAHSVEVRVDDASARPGAANGAQVDPSLLCQPLGHRRRDDPSGGGRDGRA